MVWHYGAKPVSSPCSKISYRQILFYLTFTVLKNNYIWLHPWQTRQHLKKIWNICMLVLVFDDFKRYLLQCQFSQKRRKNCLQIWTFHSEVTAWKRSRYVLKYFEKYRNVYVMYHVPFPWMPLILYYLWFLPSMMEPIKMRHHLNITIPNGSWSICSTIRCIFLAVVLQALFVMRSDEVEGGLPISSTSRSGALARLFKYSK